jgi:hypothetical protein
MQLQRHLTFKLLGGMMVVGFLKGRIKTHINWPTTLMGPLLFMTIKITLLVDLGNGEDGIKS